MYLVKYVWVWLDAQMYDLLRWISWEVGEEWKKTISKLQITYGVAKFIMEYSTVVREMSKSQVTFQDIYINRGIALSWMV